MRNYIYIWNDPIEKYLIISGIEFKDFKYILNNNHGYILLDHNSEYCKYDTDTGFDYIMENEIQKVREENIYSWGNCTWVDFIGETIPKISEQEIAELLYFKHRAKPLNSIKISSLKNYFLAYAHDDGWFLKIYYNDWSYTKIIVELINKKMKCILNIEELFKGIDAFWIKKGIIEKEEKTLHIDNILQKRERRPTTSST